MRKSACLAVLFFLALSSRGQQITRISPVTQNVSGGSYVDNNSFFKYFDWSVGELVLTNTLAPTDSSVVVYNGVLQSFTEHYGNSPTAADFVLGDYKLLPNPTNGKFEIHFFVREQGQMELELVDATGRSIEKRSFPYNGCCRTEYFDISRLPAGVYVLSATISPDPFTTLTMNQVTRHSGIRIIKLDQ
jgi:hypothetical protein